MSFDQYYEGVCNRFFVHFPLYLQGKYLPHIISQKLPVEIRIDHEVMDSELRFLLPELKEKLDQAQLPRTVHGPYQDLHPGSKDRAIREVSKKRILEALNLVRDLKPLVIVLHTCLIPWEEDYREAGKSNSPLVDSFQEILTLAKNYELKIALENVFDPDPDVILELASNLKADNLGFCFDIGHSHVFSKTSVKDWLDAFSDRLWEVHLHDNHGPKPNCLTFGAGDEHLPIGEGNIDFKGFLLDLKEHHLNPILTLEAHDEQSMVKNIAAMRELLKHL